MAAGAGVEVVRTRQGKKEKEEILKEEKVKQVKPLKNGQEKSIR